MKESALIKKREKAGLQLKTIGYRNVPLKEPEKFMYAVESSIDGDERTGTVFVMSDGNKYLFSDDIYTLEKRNDLWKGEIWDAKANILIGYGVINYYEHVVYKQEDFKPLRIGVNQIIAYYETKYKFSKD